MREYTVGQILDALSGKLLYGRKESLVHHVCTDSRKAKSGDLFFALIGAEKNGHNYLGQVLENGCKTIVISEENKIPKKAFSTAEDDVNVILVKNTTVALQELAKDYLRRLPLKKKIGITGSVGKTSTRDMVYYIAKTKYKTGRNPKNFNNWFGLPLSILDFPEDTEIAVLEMGMSGKGEIKNLARIVEPDVGIITNIGISHVGNFPDREGILKAKMEITTFFNEKSVLVVNGDNSLLNKENTSGSYQTVRVGTSKDADYRVSNIRDFGDKGIEYTLSYEGRDYHIKLPVAGAHNAINATLAIAASEQIEIGIETAIEGLKEIRLTENRLNVIEKGGVKLIDDSYNACPESMSSAIDTLAATMIEDGGRKIAVLGDIFELGRETEQAHREVGKYLGTREIDVLIAVGENAKYYGEEALKKMEKDKVFFCKDHQEATELVKTLMRDGDVILFKASNAMRLHDAVRELTENEIVAKF